MVKQLQLIVIILLISVSAVSKQYRFDYIGVEHGLSDPTVRSIYQDETNRLWFATHDGLNCYDGNTLREFRQQTENGITINTHRIYEISGDKNGHIYLRSSFGVIELDLRTEKMRMIIEKNVSAIKNSNGFLWVGFQNTIQRYDTKSRTFSAGYTLPWEALRIVSMHDDRKGFLWIATQDHGLLRLSLKERKVARLFGDTFGRNVFEDREGAIWFTTQSDGVFKINPANLSIISHLRHNPADESTISSGFNRAITQDDKGNIWLGTNNGLTCIEYGTNKISRFKSSNFANSLTSSSILSLYTDNRGTIWVGTYFGGVSYFNPSNQNYNYIVSEDDNKPTYPAVGTFAEDRYGTIWVGTEGGGLYRYTPDKQGLDYYNVSNSGLSSNYIKKIIPDTNDNIVWIAADQTADLQSVNSATGAISKYFINPEGTRPNALFSIAVTDKIVYLGTNLGVIAYNKATTRSSFVYRLTSQFNATSNDLLVDSKGRLWFAINNFPVSYSTETSELTYYSYNINHFQSETSMISNIFYEDKQGQIWLGTNGYGLLLLNEDNKSFDYEDHFSELKDKSIMAIAETKQKNMLITTVQALYIFNPIEKNLSKQQYSNGFPLKALIKRGLYVSNSGEIYIGGIPTMVIYQEKDLIAENRPDQIQLTSLIVNNKEVHPGDASNILNQALPFTSEIALKPKQNFVTLMFSTDNYFKTNDDRIEYRLKGYDKNWNDVSLGHTITYTSLSPGRYLFEIRSKDDKENVRSLKIRVKSPYYATIWAYLFYMIIVSIIIYYLVREYHTRVRLNASLAYQEREKQQIEDMNQSKIRFFINVSHEIRTPVTLVLAQTETLLNSPHLSSKIRNKILNIHRHLLSLKHLITELMDFRKQERGELKLKFAETDLVAMLREHFNLFKGLAETRNIEFSFISPVEKLMVWVDSEQLIKVVNNLTINAFKFTPEGGSVSINVDEDADDVLITFEDTGIGIPASEKDKIFNRFYQADNSEGSGGTGIGLALSKGLVEEHRGRIWVESEVGKGSKFIVRLPKGTDHIPPEQKQVAMDSIKAQYQLPNEEELSELGSEFTEETDGADRPKVLIVEDHDELRELLASTLSSVYTIETAVDGIDGWEKVRTFLPHLVITDVMMPRMSGVDLCARIKKNYDLCHIPVVLLTARQSPEYEIEGFRLGADSYLTKPFEFKKLIVVSNNLINSRRLIQKKFEQNRKFDTEIAVTNEYEKEFINKVTAIVQEHLEDEKFDVEVLARELGVSRSKLFGKIKQIAGTTPNAIIQELRLKKAADYLLNNPEMNIADISYQLGFNSPRYFNKCFKESFGVAPLHFKKENKKN
ncbi:MAG: two-component regulator propeller domain-containing protein [Paludibacter sp.]|jgi:signal transduction histidine kinase/ligand-binding sensor domain-containing protein/DNA-binding response OmpR family regulator|nr:two-component regulator propeller domain-containing protein [Paludibacter sp.]